MCQHMPYGTSGLSPSTAPTPVSQVLLKLGGIEPREPSSGSMDKCPPLLPSAEGAPCTRLGPGVKQPCIQSPALLATSFMTSSSLPDLWEARPGTGTPGMVLTLQSCCKS